MLWVVGACSSFLKELLCLLPGTAWAFSLKPPLKGGAHCMCTPRQEEYQGTLLFAGAVGRAYMFRLECPCLCVWELHSVGHSWGWARRKVGCGLTQLPSWCCVPTWNSEESKNINSDLTFQIIMKGYLIKVIRCILFIPFVSLIYNC